MRGHYTYHWLSVTVFNGWSDSPTLWDCVVFNGLFRLDVHKHTQPCRNMPTPLKILHKCKNICQILVFKFLEFGLLDTGL